MKKKSYRALKIPKMACSKLVKFFLNLNRFFPFFKLTTAGKIFNYTILNLNRNKYYLVIEIEYEQTNISLFDRVTFLEKAIFRILRDP